MKKLLFLSILTTMILSSCVNKKNKSEEKKEATPQISVESIIKIPSDFSSVYTIIKEEDISLNQIKRIQQRITLPAGLAKENVLNNLRVCAIEIYKTHKPQALSIMAYNNESEINNSYTIAKYEFCPYGEWSNANSSASLSSFKEKYDITDAYLNPKIRLFAKGDFVQLFRKEKWDASKQEFVLATTTNISKDARSFSEENIIKEAKNNTKAQIIDIYEEALTGGSIWRVYKIKIPSPKPLIGWVDEANVKTTD